MNWSAVVFLASAHWKSGFVVVLLPLKVFVQSLFTRSRFRALEGLPPFWIRLAAADPLGAGLLAGQLLSSTYAGRAG